MGGHNPSCPSVWLMIIHSRGQWFARMPSSWFRAILLVILGNSATLGHEVAEQIMPNAKSLAAVRALGDTGLTEEEQQILADIESEAEKGISKDESESVDEGQEANTEGGERQATH